MGKKEDGIKIPEFMEEDFRIEIDPNVFEAGEGQKEGLPEIDTGFGEGERLPEIDLDFAAGEDYPDEDYYSEEDRGENGTNKMRKNEEEQTESRPKRNSNREILFATYFFLLIFLGLLVKFAYFIYHDSSGIINNSYNQRQDLLSETVVRGKILASGGEVLAETKTRKNGKEMRYYPYDNLFCHVVGRVEQGKTGIELSQNISLLTSDTNLFSKVSDQMKGEKSRGNDVVTTLDVSLQQAAYEALGSQKGAVVVMEPSTGKILAMVSKNDYNPNTVSENWNILSGDMENTPLLNRACQGLYPPGSSFKILTALSYIRQKKNYNDYQYDCTGKDIFSGVAINCYNNNVHGTEDLKKSFAKSCNTSFANLAMELDIGKFRNLCQNFLFNRELPTELPYTKSSFELSAASPRDEIPQTAIGQGKTQITPLHNAMIAATVANDGVMMEPYVVDRIESANGTVISKNKPEKYKRLMSRKEAGALQEMMEAVVTEGTATQLSGQSYTAAGKTGSAEFNAAKDTHAWFVGYAPAKDPEIAVGIVVENSGTGGVYAVPAAKQIFDAYFS